MRPWGPEGMPIMEIIFTYARLSYSPGSPAQAERWKRFQRLVSCGVGVTLKRDILLKKDNLEVENGICTWQFCEFVRFLGMVKWPFQRLFFTWQTQRLGIKFGHRGWITWSLSFFFFSDCRVIKKSLFRGAEMMTLNLPQVLLGKSWPQRWWVTPLRHHDVFFQSRNPRNPPAKCWKESFSFFSEFLGIFS